MSTKIVQRAFGGPESLELVDVPAPTAADLGPGDVLVAVAAAGVNPIDVMTREGDGMAAAGIIELPFTPGWDVAGTVAAVGADVTGLELGQRVLGLARFPREGGAYAEHAVVPADDLVPAPENLADEQAGALPMAAMTAWQAFADTTSVGPGQRVHITGAGGGVGHLAVQIAHRLGGNVVAVASEGKHDWLKSLGADETVDYRDPEAMAALVGTADVALSLAAGSRATALRAVRPGGTLVALGGGAGDLEAEAGQAGVRFAATHVHTQRGWLESVVDLAAKGELVPTVSAAFALAEAADAHRAVESGHSTGKVVLLTTPQH
ncbi:NADP-dependent oxidoreductase [Saccharopolyspora sp. 6T]|uniref:NADP-dependent oxidoreductase n=1 Tax=Saccharopolyspora sp. 6T TaxID=2877238 RepID=UPI001CD7D47D|nr:NADP-dependent oxidoreductase [Saccharopolyspora sp. 6T]MCA1188498.1 NADP-dependent oxidoreductase [Saccharopolyspora sp. 6T]